MCVASYVSEIVKKKKKKEGRVVASFHRDLVMVATDGWRGEWQPLGLPPQVSPYQQSEPLLVGRDWVMICQATPRHVYRQTMKGLSDSAHSLFRIDNPVPIGIIQNEST